jgi:hypothetical protein
MRMMVTIPVVFGQDGVGRGTRRLADATDIACSSSR